MLATKTMTQVGLRLRLVELGLHGLIDRSVKDPALHEIVEYCVPRRLLRDFCIWGQRGNQGFMWFRVEIDYAEHDRQVKLSAHGVPQEVLDESDVEYGPSAPNAVTKDAPGSCPHINKAVDLFVKAAGDRGLQLTWGASFTERHDELARKFHLVGNPNFQDRTSGIPATTMIHSTLPELMIRAAAAPEPSDSTGIRRVEDD